MKLYHFTSRQNALKIRKEGLTKGLTLLKSGLMANTQWLTSNPSVEQEGIKGVLKIVDRTEARITVNIPAHLLCNILTFDQFCDLHRGDLMDYFDTEPEITKDWYVYMGVLRPLWLRVRVYNHSL